jgi:hypothetical protein
VKLRGANNPSVRSSLQENIRRIGILPMQSAIPPKVAENEPHLENRENQIFIRTIITRAATEQPHFLVLPKV